MSTNSKKINEIDIDMKTKAVFTKKGYEIQGQIGCGAFGQVMMLNYLTFQVQFFCFCFGFRCIKRIILKMT